MPLDLKPHASPEAQNLDLQAPTVPETPMTPQAGLEAENVELQAALLVV